MKQYGRIWFDWLNTDPAQPADQDAQRGEIVSIRGIWNPDLKRQPTK
jgi:hypothetical protein